MTVTTADGGTIGYGVQGGALVVAGAAIVAGQPDDASVPLKELIASQK